MGHLYPEKFSRCPVCEKADALKTHYYGSVFKAGPLPEKSESETLDLPAVDHPPDPPSDPWKMQGDTGGQSFVDADRTLLLGQAGVNVAAGLGGWLVAMTGDDIPVKSYELYLHKKHRIGRGADNDIVLPNNRPSISRRHCMIDYAAPYFMIHDNHSANGTQVNDVPVTSHPLADMDIILLGDQKYRIKYLNPPVDAAP